MRRAIATAASLLALTAASVTAGPAPVSQYQSVARMSCLDPEGEHAPDDSGEDHVFYHCRGLAGVPVWMLYQDAAHLSIGFGSRENTHGMYNIDRNGAWPLEWRGTYSGGAFRPFAVILRVSDPYARNDRQNNRLVVYGLTADGAGSCVLGEASGRDEGRKARAIADNAKGRGCGGRSTSEE